MNIKQSKNFRIYRVSFFDGTDELELYLDSKYSLMNFMENADENLVFTVSPIWLTTV